MQPGMLLRFGVTVTCHIVVRHQVIRSATAKARHQLCILHVAARLPTPGHTTLTPGGLIAAHAKSSAFWGLQLLYQQLSLAAIKHSGIQQ
jgi:hypothetical protein